MAELLKISELAARAGVMKSTVQHYLREGLLPPPVTKPHRNMHYYSSDLVERIQIIRELQSRRNLPLAKIKALLADRAGTGEIRAYLYSPAVAPIGGQRMSRSQLLRDTGLEPAHLDALEDMGFIRAERRGRRTSYTGPDVAIAFACASMQKAGLNADNGFLIEDMAFYLHSMRELLVQEVALFTKVLGKLPRERILELARSGIEGTSSLLLALRRKVLLDLVGDTGDGGSDADS